MSDSSKAQKLKLANSRKRFKELQELKKKKETSQKSTENNDNSNNNNEHLTESSLTSSTHSSVHNELAENVATTDNTSNYFNISNYSNSIHQSGDHEQSSRFFDNLTQDKPENISDNSSAKVSNYFTQSSRAMENIVSNIVDSPKSKDTGYDNNYCLFGQENQHTYLKETQDIIHPSQDSTCTDNLETRHDECRNSENELFSAKTQQNLLDYLQGNNEGHMSEAENRAIQGEIAASSNMAQAEIQHSSIESLRQLSNQMAQLMEPEYPGSDSITDLEKRNLELAALLEQEKIKTDQQKALINDLHTTISRMEAEKKENETTNLQVTNEISRLKEELQCHIQTVGLLVGEKTELSAALSQLELSTKQKNAECEELQARLKASRSRVADLERELNIFKVEKQKFEVSEQQRSEVLNKLRQEYDGLKEEKEELIQDLLEAREKVKTSSEENLKLQHQNHELSSKLSLADIKIQQITNGEQFQVESRMEKLSQEKFQLEKQISNLQSILKTITKERDDSSTQYQQYAQQLNAQVSNLSNRIEQLQQENENLKIQEQSRIKHIGELERQLQNLQNEQVAFATTRPNGDSNLKAEVENLRELCVQLQIEKTTAEENYTKAINERDMLTKELMAKYDSISQLESEVERLRGNQPDSAKLLATMESDKVAAARAVKQNGELKEQVEGMQEVLAKLDNDKVELTEKLNSEVNSNKELLDKLQKTELQLQRLTDAIEIKDRELGHLRESFTELNKQVLQQGQLADRLRHYEAQDNSSHVLQNELQEAKQMIIKLTNEVNILKNGNIPDKSILDNSSEEVSSIKQKLEELEIKNRELEVKLENGVNKESDGINLYRDNQILDKEEAMKYLEEKFNRTMQDIAELTEEKQRLEHLVMQLQGETETIGEYVALYQHQRMMLKQRATEKDQQLKQLAKDREQIRMKLDKLNYLIKKLVAEKGPLSAELLAHHENLVNPNDDNVNINGNVNEINGGKTTETAEEIISLLGEIKTSNLVEPNENFHHCSWCSGQLITV